MVKDFKRWTTQLAATVLYNGRGAANLLGRTTFPMHNFGYDYLPQIKISILLFLAVICILLFHLEKMYQTI